MPLKELSFRCGSAAIPADVRRFLHEADRRIERFQNANCIPGFVPSDFECAYRFLRALADSVLAPGSRFCEWGSGFGVVTCLAAMIGFDACGLEIEGPLVDEARRLAEDFDLPVEFVCGSFVPVGGEACLRNVGEFSWLVPEGQDTSGELGLEPDDHDVIFVYPWPDEESSIAGLFERYAASGALLITHHGSGRFRLRKKTRRA